MDSAALLRRRRRLNGLLRLLGRSLGRVMRLLGTLYARVEASADAGVLRLLLREEWESTALLGVLSASYTGEEPWVLLPPGVVLNALEVELPAGAADAVD